MGTCRMTRAHVLIRGSDLSTQVLRRTFDVWLNPLHDNTGARERLRPGLRPLRTMGIVARNALLILGAMRSTALLSGLVPALVFAAVMLLLAGVVYWQIHKRDRQGVEVKPVLIL